MAKKKRGTANPATARPIMRGGTVAAKGTRKEVTLAKIKGHRRRNEQQKKKSKVKPYAGGTVAARSKSRPKASNEKRTNITQTAGQWTDTKPVSLRQKYEKAPYYKGGTVAARPRRADKKPNEHVHRRPATGQPQYSSNIGRGAADSTRRLQATISKAVKDSKRGRR